MQAATTVEALQKVRDQHRAVIEARAKEQRRIALPERGRGPRGPGYGPRQYAPGVAPPPNVPQQPSSA